MSSVRACVVVAAGCASAEHLALCSSQFSPLPPAFLLHKSLILGAVKPLMLGAVSSDPPCGKAGLCRCFLAACWSSCAPHLGVSSRGGTWCEGMSQVLAGHPLAANQFSPAWDVLCQSWGGKGAGAGGGAGREGGSLARAGCPCVWLQPSTEQRDRQPGRERMDRKGIAISLLLLAASLASAQDAIGDTKRWDCAPNVPSPEGFCCRRERLRMLGAPQEPHNDPEMPERALGLASG